jgi:hypothetical protein
MTKKQAEHLMQCLRDVDKGKWVYDKDCDLACCGPDYADAEVAFFEVLWFMCKRIPYDGDSQRTYKISANPAILEIDMDLPDQRGLNSQVRPPRHTNRNRRRFTTEIA